MLQSSQGRFSHGIESFRTIFTMIPLHGSCFTVPIDQASDNGDTLVQQSYVAQARQ